MNLREIIEAYAADEITKAEAREKLIALGATPLDADELLYIEDGGDDVIDLDEEEPQP